MYSLGKCLYQKFSLDTGLSKHVQHIIQLKRVCVTERKYWCTVQEYQSRALRGNVSCCRWMWKQTSGEAWTHYCWELWAMRQEAAIFPLVPTVAACSASPESSPDTSGLTLEKNRTLAHTVRTEPAEKLTWRNTANGDTSTDPNPNPRLPQNYVATGCHTGNHTPNNSNNTRFLHT